MTTATCKAIEERLVDYTDDLLDSEACQAITEHLGQCEACQRRAAALKKSLALTRVIWQDVQEQHQGKPVARRFFGPQTRRWALRGTAAAAIVFLASLVSLQHRPPHPAPPPLTAEHVEMQIEVEASAARLLATAKLLDRKPHAQALAQKQYQYILDHYPTTRAGIQTETQLR